MKTRTLISILIPFLAVLIIISSCASTPLIESTKWDNIKEVKRLIEEGADVNERDYLGYTALLVASEYGHTEIVKLLLKAGSDINEQTKDGYTALIYASKGGYTEIVKLLKEAEQ